MFKWVSLILLITSISQIWTYESFADFPLTLENGNYMIHATLTDLTYSKKYFMKELIYSSEYTNGKISITSQHLSSSIDVHYGSSSENQRLLIQDYDCNLFTYQTKWDKKIKGIIKPLITHILLVGPSLIYRLNHRSFAWQTGNDADVRGTTMKSVHTTIGGTSLNVTIYYKDTLTTDDGILQPSRIQFSGKDPSDYSYNANSNLILDYYLQTQTSEELDKVVIPKPGIGCPIVFESDKSFDKRFLSLTQNSIHFTSIENVDGPKKSSTRKEIYANEANQLLSLKTTSSEVETESIYDYVLGIIYVKQDLGCKTTPMTLNSLGVTADLYKRLSIASLIQTVNEERYLGQTWFKNQPGFSTDVWESIVYNGTTSSGQYEKVVTTIHTVDSESENPLFSKIPVGKTIHAYKTISTGSYSLVETTTIDYYDFGKEITKDEYEDRFRIGDCFLNPADKKTLAIHFACKEGESCGHDLKKYPYSIEETVRLAIHGTETISGARIGNINIVLDSHSLIAYVTFFNFPNLLSGFESSYMYLSSDVFKSVPRTTAKSLSDCLKQKAKMETNFEVVAYCYSEQLCSGIKKIGDLVETKQNGIGCNVFYIPLRNLKRYNRETPLEKLEEELKSKALIFFFDGLTVNSHSVSRIDEVTKPESKSYELFIIEDEPYKLVEDGTITLIATSAANFADCYRACANFDKNNCETFSFCQESDKVECLLSTSIYANVTDKRIYSNGCKIYRKNRLLDYIKINNRAFINPTSIATGNRVEDCADLCSQYDECFSFQISPGKCQFEGYYTDSATKYKENSDIYIPKLSHKYAPTGVKIVTDTTHTELHLTLDQCAALCYDMSSSDGDCISFNFCSKDRAATTCSLSKYSVKDSSTKTSASDICTNYERISDKYVETNQNPKVSIVKGTSGAGAFGIIVLFIGIGLLLGFSAPFIYNKSKSTIENLTTSERDTVNWNRHLNEEI